jgi:hypothetical protein
MSSLCQAVFLESRHGELAAKDVTRFIVEYSALAGIFPTGRADENAAGGKFSGFGFNLCAVKYAANVGGVCAVANTAATTAYTTSDASFTHKRCCCFARRRRC